MDCGHGLHVWCHDLGMFSKVEGEGVACPPALGLHDIERDTAEQIFKSSPDADAVALDRLEVNCPGCFS